MEVFEVVIALLLGGAVLAAVARRVGAPYPALVALAGAALALIPGVPTLVLDPELALALFVAPVLADAAFDASPRDLRINWRPVASLALGAVALTIAAVALVAKMLVPDLPWGAAVALGAIVAPPDAAAATAVLRQLRPPYRLLVILEGESLFNDASALLVYRLAVGATLAGFLSGWSVLPTLLIVTLGSVVLGLVLGRLTLVINARIRDVSTAIVVQFCSTFGVWILAEQLHLSGIITLVVFAMSASRRAPEVMPARIRVPAWAVWEVAVFVLNVLAFILVGFQLQVDRRAAGPSNARQLHDRCRRRVRHHHPRARRLGHGDRRPCPLAQQRPAPGHSSRIRCSGTFAARRPGRWLVRDAGDYHARHRAGAANRWRGWGGVSLPRPDSAHGVRSSARHARDPGAHAASPAAAPGLEDDGMVEREVYLARVETLRAAVAAAAASPDTATAALVRHSYRLQLRLAEAATEGASADAQGAMPAAADAADGREGDAAVLRAVTTSQRGRLVALRADGTIGDTAFQRVEEELDRVELGWAQLLRAGQRADHEA